MRAQKTQLIRDGIWKAVELRTKLGKKTYDPICVYDIAESREVEVEVLFQDIPSMEGMYYKSHRGQIIVSSLRPAGRQAFTVAHELGHHIFGHGTHVSQLEESNPVYSAEEVLANSFAGALLMPRTVVAHAFTKRGWDIQSCTPQQVFTVAGWLGVGYETLINQMAWTLKLISPECARQLTKVHPKDIRASILGFPHPEDLFIGDFHWDGAKAIDTQVGDIVLLPPQIVNSKIQEHHCVTRESEDGTRTVMRAIRPGKTQITHPQTGWSVFIRVSRKNYVGRSKFRHLEDPGDE